MFFVYRKERCLCQDQQEAPEWAEEADPEAPWEEEADRAWARGQEALCLHPLRRDGLAAFIGGPIPAAGVLDA